MTKLIFSLLFLFSFIQITFSQTDEEENFINLFSESQRFMMLDELDTALVLLHQCLELEPNSATTNFAISKIYFEKNDELFAIIFLEEAVRIDKKNLIYLRFLADLYFHEFEFENASKIYQDILKISPYILDYKIAASFYNSIFDYENELKVADLMIDNFGLTFDNLVYKIRVLYILNDEKNVIKNCDELISLYPDYSDSYSLYIDYLFLFENYDEALNYVNLALQKFDDDVTFNYYATEYYAINTNVDSAYFHLCKVLKNQTLIGRDILDLINNYSDFFSYSNFNSSLDTIISLLYNNYIDDFSVVDFVADYYFEHNKFYDAISVYELILQNNMVDFDTYVSLLNLYNRFELWDKLDSLSSYASEIFPAQPLVFLFKGISSLKNNNYDDAYEALIFGSSIVFDNPKLSAFFNFYLSQYFRLQNNYSNENLYFNNSISFASNNCDLLVYFAFYFAKNSLYEDKSINLIGECIMSDLQMLSPYIAYIYAYILYKYEDYDSSLKYIQIAITNSIYPNFTHYELLGNIYFKLSDFDLANMTWLKSVNYGNKFLNKEL